MRIRIQIEGGFAALPGLSAPRTVDTASLHAGDAAALEALVRAAAFFELPARVGGAQGAADVRTYTITVEDAARTHTVTAIEPIGDPALQALLDAVRARVGLPG